MIDEVQKAPELVNHALEGNITLLMAGSVDLDSFTHNTAASHDPAINDLVAHYQLRPLTLGEVDQSDPPTLLSELLQDDWPPAGKEPVIDRDPLEHLLHGLLPPLVFEHPPSSYRSWWSAYVSEYLERDLGQYARIAGLPDFRRLMLAIALRTGRTLNQSALAREAHLSQTTAHRYINLLTLSKQLERLHSGAPSGAEPVVRSPKIFWHDPALPVFLAGYFERRALEAAHELGYFFKNLVFHHLRVLADLLQPRARLYHWQTRKNQTVDFVLEHDDAFLALQVSLAAEPSPHAIHSLATFLDEFPEAVGGILIYNGDTVRDLDAKMMALPWEMLTG